MSRFNYWVGLVTGAVAMIIAPVAIRAQQQQLKPGPTPIEVSVKPSPAIPGATVTISGESVALQERRTVTIAIKPPSGAPLALTANLDAHETYSAKHKVPGVGSYSVTVTAPDGKAKRTTSFSVVAPATSLARSTQAVQRLFAAMRDVAPAAREQVIASPPSPAQEELATKLQTLQQQLQGAPAQITKLRQGLTGLNEFVAKYPEAMAELQPMYDALSEVTTEADVMERQLRDRVKSLRSDRTLCDDLDAVNEALGFLSLAMNVTLNPLRTLANILVDKTLPDRVLSRIPQLQTPADKFAASSVIKQAYNAQQGFTSFLDGQVGFVNDALQAATQKYFGAYCEKFEGPMRAQFHLEYFEGGRKWLAYDVKLDGVLYLRYEKGKSSASGIPVSGEIEGNATGFSIWEDFLVINPWARKLTLARKAVPAIPAPYVAELGKMGRFAVMPNYFYIPLKGMLQGEKLALTFDAPRQDFAGKAKFRVMYVLLSPVLPIPQVALVQLPYQGADYILTRGTRREPVFTVQVDAANKVSRIKRTFTRDEERPGSLVARFKIDIDACNPSCP
jgi:hypothetical protein